MLFGCSVPVVVRKVNHDSENKAEQDVSEKQGKWENDELFEFVGECYVDGYMNGEVLKRRKERDFVLI